MVPLFSDREGDVRNDYGSIKPEPAIDLLGGSALYQGDTVTFSLVVAELGSDPSPDLCLSFHQTVWYQGLRLDLDANRGGSFCGEAFEFTVARKRLDVAGRLDKATNSILATVSVAAIDQAIQEAVGRRGDATPPIVWGSGYDRVNVSSSLWKTIGGVSSSGDPRNRNDSAA
jgi:hypothetical protein